jgi:hypothetical protein
MMDLVRRYYHTMAEAYEVAGKLTYLEKIGYTIYQVLPNTTNFGTNYIIIYYKVV